MRSEAVQPREPPIWRGNVVVSPAVCDAPERGIWRGGIGAARAVETASLPTNLLDVIAACDVIEHTRNPKSFLERAHALLRPGGLIFLVTPSLDSWSRKLLGKRTWRPAAAASANTRSSGRCSRCCAGCRSRRRRRVSASGSTGGCSARRHGRRREAGCRGCGAARCASRIACATVLMILALPAGQMMTRETPLDADAYLREYLILSVDQPFGDETGATIATSVPPSLESPRR